MDWESTRYGIAAATRGGDQTVGFGGTPTTGFITVKRIGASQNGIHDPPCLFDIVLADKRSGISLNRVVQEFPVSSQLGGIRFLADVMVSSEQWASWSKEVTGWFIEP